ATVTLLIAVAPGLTRYLPSAALAAVVIAAVLSIVDVRGTIHLALVDRAEFGLALAAFAGVALLGVLRGVAVAVALSLAVFVARAWRPHMGEPVRGDGRKGHHDRRGPRGGGGSRASCWSASTHPCSSPTRSCSPTSSAAPSSTLRPPSGGSWC